MGTLAGAPACVMPDMSETLLGANVVCKLGNIMLVDDQKIICVGSDASTRASLSTQPNHGQHYHKDVGPASQQTPFSPTLGNGIYARVENKKSITYYGTTRSVSY